MRFSNKPDDGGLPLFRCPGLADNKITTELET